MRELLEAIKILEKIVDEAKSDTTKTQIASINWTTVNEAIKFLQKMEE